MFVDSHAHIDGPEFDSDRAEVIERANAAGVTAILNVGTGDPHNGVFERAVEFGEQHSSVFTAIGTHPHDARLYDDAADDLIRSLITKRSKIIAWGEIGLDFHYDNSPRDVQMSVFRRQLKSARDMDLPVIIHTREAEDETIQILKDEWTGARRAGVMHCFSGSLALARQAIELGFLISFSGIVTFKKAEELRAVALDVPLDRLLIETDCPFLAPVPYRGKRNEPAYVLEVARCLADLRGMEISEMALITSSNFFSVFEIEPSSMQ
ncbi:MAG TPA: TatD family hydrolase [Pyrinomonadaceae bacterium]|nr:TatD family hydrolase [Pyrinomonadaceae bacterium]